MRRAAATERAGTPVMSLRLLRAIASCFLVVTALGCGAPSPTPPSPDAGDEDRAAIPDVAPDAPIDATDDVAPDDAAPDVAPDVSSDAPDDGDINPFCPAGCPA